MGRTRDIKEVLGESKKRPKHLKRITNVRRAQDESEQRQIHEQRLKGKSGFLTNDVWITFAIETLEASQSVLEVDLKQVQCFLRIVVRKFRIRDMSEFFEERAETAYRMSQSCRHRCNYFCLPSYLSSEGMAVSILLTSAV